MATENTEQLAVINTAKLLASRGSALGKALGLVAPGI